MQIKTEKAELERHRHDEPRMLLEKDAPVDLAHNDRHCEADKDAHNERTHAQERVFAAVGQNDGKDDEHPKEQVGNVSERPVGLGRIAAREIHRAHTYQRDADHHNGDARHGGRDDLAQERHHAAPRHDHEPADEAYAEERRKRLFPRHPLILHEQAPDGDERAGKREARRLNAQHAGADAEGPGYLKPDPYAREQQGHADKVGDGLRGNAQRARDDGGRRHDAEHHGQNVLEGGQQGRAERRVGLKAVNQFASFFRAGRSGLRGRGAGHRHPPEAWGWEIFAGKTSAAPAGAACDLFRGYSIFYGNRVSAYSIMRPRITTYGR